MKRFLLLFILCLLFNGCSKTEDYYLGTIKDFDYYSGGFLTPDRAKISFYKHETILISRPPILIINRKLYYKCDFFCSYYYMKK